MTIHSLFIPPSFRVQHCPSSLPHFNSKMEEAWAKAKQTGKLHDGTLFAAKSWDESTLLCFSIPYSLYALQHLAPSLCDFHPLYAVSIQGMVTCCQHLLLGLRSSSCLQYPHHWECVPAGGIDNRCLQGNEINYRQQLFCELFEEVGLASSAVDLLVPSALIRDISGKTIDIVIFIELNIDPNTIQSQWQSTATKEYDEIRLLPFSSLSSFCHSHQVVPTLSIIFELFSNTFLKYTR